jgi:hypothetical protein
MAKITVELPDSLLGEIIKDANSQDTLEERLPELLRLGLIAGRSPTGIYQYVLNFIVSNPTHDEVMQFKPTVEMQERLKDLLAKSASGQLNSAEEQELHEYERIEHLIIMLKSGSLRYLS